MGKKERWSKDEMPICHGTKDDPNPGFLMMIQGLGTQSDPELGVLRAIQGLVYLGVLRGLVIHKDFG